MLFICGGAFHGLEKIIEQRSGHNGMGFNAVLRVRNANTDQFGEVMPEDLLKFGMIPELVGLPVITSVHNLDRDALIQILTEPRNALVKQYRRLFELDGVDLEFTPDSLEAIADQANLRGTGARGLRAILEEVLQSVVGAEPQGRGARRDHARGRTGEHEPDDRPPGHIAGALREKSPEPTRPRVCGARVTRRRGSGTPVGLRFIP